MSIKATTCFRMVRCFWTFQKGTTISKAKEESKTLPFAYAVIGHDDIVQQVKSLQDEANGVDENHGRIVQVKAILQP